MLQADFDSLDQVLALADRAVACLGASIAW